VDAEEGADHGLAQPTARRQHGHRPVAIGQAAVIEPLEQARQFGQVADLAAQRLVADLLLKERSHPLERGALGLLSSVGLWRSYGDATKIAKELLGTGR